MSLVPVSPSGQPPAPPTGPAIGFGTPAAPDDAATGSSIRTVQFATAPGLLVPTSTKRAVVRNRGPSRLMVGPMQAASDGMTLAVGDRATFSSAPLYGRALDQPLNTALVEVALDAELDEAHGSLWTPRLLASTNQTSTSTVNSGPFDVSDSEGVLVRAAYLANGGFLQTLFSWTDASGLMVTAPVQPFILSGVGQAGYYYVRNLGPLLSVQMIVTGYVGPGAATVAVWTDTRPAAHDGIYTPGVQGSVLGFSDSLATGGTVTLLPYAGPAKFQTVGGNQVLLEYEDSGGVFHIFASWTQITAAGVVVTPVDVQVPPMPCRVRNPGAATVSASVIAA